MKNLPKYIKLDVSVARAKPINVRTLLYCLAQAKFYSPIDFPIKTYPAYYNPPEAVAVTMIEFKIIDQIPVVSGLIKLPINYCISKVQNSRHIMAQAATPNFTQVPIPKNDCLSGIRLQACKRSTFFSYFSIHHVTRIILSIGFRLVLMHIPTKSSLNQFTNNSQRTICTANVTNQMQTTG